MLLQCMRNELVRYLTAAQAHCPEADYRDLCTRLTRLPEPLPALDTPIGYREAIRQGTWILDGIYQAVLRRHQMPASADRLR